MWKTIIAKGLMVWCKNNLIKIQHFTINVVLTIYYFIAIMNVSFYKNKKAIKHKKP